MQEDLRIHLSNHRCEGSLCDTPLPRVLEECFDHQVTGTITICCGDRQGTLELRAGVVDRAEFSGVRGDSALEILSRLRTGTYEVAQRLPDLAGELGSAGELEGNTEEVPPVELMRYCEENALSCKIILIRGFDRAEITYRAGDVTEVSLNGERDEDRIVDIVRFERARFRVSAPPLDLDIEGWPASGRAPTSPFVLDRGFVADEEDESGLAEPVECDERPEAIERAPEYDPVTEEDFPEELFHMRSHHRLVRSLVTAGVLVVVGCWVYLMALTMS